MTLDWAEIWHGTCFCDAMEEITLTLMLWKVVVGYFDIQADEYRMIHFEIQIITDGTKLSIQQTKLTKLDKGKEVYMQKFRHYSDIILFIISYL